MSRLPTLRGSRERLSFEMGVAFAQARSLSDLQECAEWYLVPFCQADHVALCLAHPERPLEYEWKTRTLDCLLRNYPEWGHHDFVGRAVMARRNHNRALSDVQMLQGRKLEEMETWRRSRAQGMRLRHVLSAAIVPGQGAGHGGVTLYSERRKPFSEEQRSILQWVVPSIQRVFLDMTQPRERVLLREDWSALLTPRERELANLFLSRGGTNQQLAEDMGITETTVKTFFKNIRKATGIENRSDLMARGRRPC